MPTYISEKSADEGAEVYCSVACAGAERSGVENTQDNWYFVGYGCCVAGDTKCVMLNKSIREYGPLEEWQYDALFAGHDEGVRDQREHEEYMAALGAAVSVDGGSHADLPF